MLLFPDIAGVNGRVIDAGAVRDSDLSAVMCKATQGLTFRDKAFASNLGVTVEAGLLPGAYHFLERGGGAEQADAFLMRVVELFGADLHGLLLMVDVELQNDDPPI